MKQQSPMLRLWELGEGQQGGLKRRSCPLWWGNVGMLLLPQRRSSWAC